MDILSKLRQKCVYWAPLGVTTTGAQTFDYPAELRCRWEEKDMLIIDGRGEEIRSSTQVYVENDVEIDGLLYYGLLDDIDGTEDPRLYAMPIQSFKKLPDLRAEVYLRIAYL